jgi:CBS domain containing-hemolysin-like protein
MEELVPILLKILAVVVLVLLNGFFVAAEFALVKVRDTQLTPLVAKGNRGAKVARKVLAKLDASLSACQLGITLASLGLGWVGEPVFAALLTPVLDLVKLESETWRHSISFFVGFSVLTFLHITAGEQAPKWLAIQKPLPTSLWVARPLAWFHGISWPFIWVLNRASLQLLRWLGLNPASEGEHSHSEEELRLLFTTAQARSGGSTLGRDVVLNALDLGRREVREVMRPRHEMAVLDTTSTIQECLELAEHTRFSRFPVCEEGDLDRTQGVVHVKDLFSARHKVKVAADLKPYMRKIIYVPPTARLETVLQSFLEQKLHLGVVVDEYGGTTGMITLENILEELVGQIQDEFDQEKPRVVQLDDIHWDLDGGLPLHELGELVGETLEDELVATTGGWITQLLGGFPKRGDKVRREGYELRVESMEGMRVARVRLTRDKKQPPEGTSGGETQA